MKTFLLTFLFSISITAYSQCQVSVAMDTVSGCVGDTVWLNASGSTSYTWTGNGLSCLSCPDPYVVISANDQLVVEGTSQSTVLANNGDFSQGNTGFTTSYIHNPTTIWNEGTYAVGPNPNAVHPNFGTWGDHTTGSGNYLLVNGSTSGTRNLWTQSVSFPPGVQVTMDWWMLTFVTPPGSLRLRINGTNTGPSFATPTSSGVWQNYSQTFTSSTTGNTQVQLVTVSSALAGNDFGLDDIRYSYSCTSFDTVYVRVDHPPVIAASETESSTGCDEVCVNWTNISSLNSTEASYMWDFGDGSPRESVFETSHCYSAEGTYYVWLYGQSNTGCLDSSIVDTVTVGRTILFDDYIVSSSEGYWSGAVYVLPSQDPTLTVNFNFLSGGAVQQVYVNWGDGTDDSYGPFSNISSHTVSHTFQSFDPLQICAWVETPIGCVDSICFNVSFTPWIESPNVFSPNGDGINDGYSPRFYAADRVKWTVYNRWGREVYSSQSTTDVWDGTFSGNELAEGVYYVVAIAEGADSELPYEIHTSITLMRNP